MSVASSTLHISGLARQSMAALRSQAKQKGLSPERYVRELVEEHLAREHLARTTTFDQLFAPVRSRAGKVAEGELDQLVDRVRAKQPRRGRRQKG